jgi:ElaB/YqjD/DUF883 family membrane-anchored ribosome-binding protein
MNEIAQNRQAICDFLNKKKIAETAPSAATPSKAQVSAESLKALTAIGSAGLAQAWQQHPAKQTYDQIAPIAQGLVRQYPWASLGAASALGALCVLSPSLRRHAVQSLQEQLPADLKTLLF